MTFTKEQLYTILSSLFCVLVLIANLVSSKLILFPQSDFIIPVGLLLYPLTLFINDVITELYGPKKSQYMILSTFFLTIFGAILIKLFILLPPHDLHFQDAYEKVLGANSWTVFASLTGYLLGQMIDIRVYETIRHLTKDNYLWLRNSGAAAVSQLIDTIVVNLIYLYFALNLPLFLVLKAILFSYLYKMTFNTCLLPLFYLVINRLDFIKVNKTPVI